MKIADKDKLQFNKDKDTEKNQLLLEQYKLYMEMLDRSTKRRMDTNTLFISVNALLVTVATLFHKGDTWTLYLLSGTGFLFSCVWYVLLCYYKIVNQVKWEVLYMMEKNLPCNPFATEWPIMKNMGNSQPETQNNAQTNGTAAVTENKNMGNSQPETQNNAQTNGTAAVTENKRIVAFFKGIIDFVIEVLKLLVCFFRNEKHYKSISVVERNLPRVFAIIYVGIGIYAWKHGGSANADLSKAVTALQDAVSELTASLAEIALAGIGG